MKPKAEAQAAEAVAAPAPDAAMLLLLQRIQELEAKMTALQPADPIARFGPPPPPRSERPHIMIYVTPDTAVRREVSPEYIAKKLPGWDGTPVKAYLNHQNTVLAK